MSEAIGAERTARADWESASVPGIPPMEAAGIV